MCEDKLPRHVNVVDSLMEDPKESVVRGRGAWKMSEKWVENE